MIKRKLTEIHVDSGELSLWHVDFGILRYAAQTGVQLAILDSRLLGNYEKSEFRDVTKPPGAEPVLSETRRLPATDFRSNSFILLFSARVETEPPLNLPNQLVDQSMAPPEL